MMEHSDLYEYYVEDTVNGKRLKSEQLAERISKGLDLQLLCDLLRETNDAQSGIVSGVDKSGAWVRDATASLPLDRRLPHEAPVIEANNALLRVLSRLRPILYAIKKKYGSDITGLRSRLAEFTRKILGNCQSIEEIQALETEFNTILIHALHKANLTKGCSTQQDAKKLLFHYRNLSSLLISARTMVTLTYDELNQVLTRDTQYPVTKKTEKQSRFMANQMNDINPYPLEGRENAHNLNNAAIQEANKLFSGEFAKDDRALAAQTRKTHPASIKNAFITKIELCAITPAQLASSEAVSAAIAFDTLHLGRMAVPVYVGPGETEEAIQTHTRENLQQLREKAEELGIFADRTVKKIDVSLAEDEDSVEMAPAQLHITCLNTYSVLDKQMVMINHLKKATRRNVQSQDKFSYVPVNTEGTTRIPNIDPSLSNNTRVSGHYAPGQKADRHITATATVLGACAQPNTLSVVNCASGQDRTGTVIESVIQKWQQLVYVTKNLDISTIDDTRARSGSAAEITSHLLNGGSPGMKPESVANNALGSKTTFSDAATREFYRKSANTNKKNSVNNVDFLEKVEDQAILEFQLHLNSLEDVLKNIENTNYINPKRRSATSVQLCEKGWVILEKIKNKALDPWKLSPSMLADFSAALEYCRLCLENCRDKNNIEKMAGMIFVFEKNSDHVYQALGCAFLSFTLLSFVAAGILLAIPSGGVSLLMPLLSSAASSWICLGAVAGSALIGCGFFKYGFEKKGLVKAVDHFNLVLWTQPTEEQSRVAAISGS